jgi:phage tail-like protein
MPRRDPYLSTTFRVLVELDGVEEAAFTDCTGLVVETDVEERREGGQNYFTHRFPRGTKYGNLVLKRGLADSDLLWRWHQQVVTGQIDPKNISIVLTDEQGNEAWRWNVERAFPVKWSGPDFKADGSAVAIEALELAHHGISKQ